MFHRNCRVYLFIHNKKGPSRISSSLWSSVFMHIVPIVIRRTLKCYWVIKRYCHFKKTNSSVTKKPIICWPLALSFSLMEVMEHVFCLICLGWYFSQSRQHGGCVLTVMTRVLASVRGVAFFVGFVANGPYKSMNTLRQRQNGWNFADNILKCILLNEKIWILIDISLKFVLKDLINNIPALVQIMAWCRTGIKPLSEPMVA